MDFIPDHTVLLQFISAAIILTLIPGPDMMLFLSRTITYGRTAAFATVAGAFSGIVCHVLLAALGLSALIVTAPYLFWALKVFGALYLLWLAWQAVTSKSTFNLVLDTKKQQPSLKQHYLTGLGINLLNPKIILFNMTFLPQFVEAYDPHAVGKLLFLGLLFIPTAFPFIVAVVLLGEKLTKFLKHNPIVLRILDYVLACTFMAFAVKLLMTEGMNKP